MNDIIERAHQSEISRLARRYGISVEQVKLLYEVHRRRLEEGSRFYRYVPILAGNATEEEILGRKEKYERAC